MYSLCNVHCLANVYSHHIVTLSKLATFTPPEPDGLAVLLQLGDELVALLDHVHVLLVLVVWAVCLDDALDAVDGARYAVGGDEFGEVPGTVSRCTSCETTDLPVKKVHCHTKVVGHALQTHDPV
jgi:hypothetical protein